MAEFPAIDADGHITESTEQLRPYFEGSPAERALWTGRRSYYPEDGWDRSLGGRLGSNVNDAKSWLRIMDEGGLEATILYPTAGLAIGWVREPDFAVALCRAYNNFVHQEFLTVSPRLQAVALLPFQDVPEAVKELRRAVTELGMVGAFAPAVGLRCPSGARSFIRSTPRRSDWDRWWPAMPPCGVPTPSGPTGSTSSSRCTRSPIPWPR